MNQGNADFSTKEDLILANIIDSDADVIFISEANSHPEDVSKKNSLLKTFKG